MNAPCRTMGFGTLVLMLAACGTQAPSQDPHGETPGERPTVAVTSWTDRTELFMEYPTLVEGEQGRFAIHVTDLAGFTPLTSGEVEVVLRSDDGRESRFRGGLSRPGIFGVDVTPPGPGRFDMSLKVDAAGLQEIHNPGFVIILGAGSAVPAEPESASESITFLKEQQWTLEFGTEEVSVRVLQPSLVVPGTVRPRPGGEALLPAPVSGLVDPASTVPLPGASIRAGGELVRIIPGSEENRDAAGLRAALAGARQEHELAIQERDRAARLVDSRALPARRLSEAEAALSASTARLEAAMQRLDRLGALTRTGDPLRSNDWFIVRAPFDGVIAEVRMTPGSSVVEGEALLRLVDTGRVQIQGAVPESRVSTLAALGRAELIVEREPPRPLGRAVAIGSTIEPSSRTVEVRYDMDNGQARLPVGLGVRLRLFVGEAKAHAAVPESAIVEDAGRPVVFVQTGGESFERRAVRLGDHEGGYVHALEGVEPGERVVSSGAYLLRLAAMSTQIPSHGHVH